MNCARGHSKNRISVIGGAGFIGTYLCKELRAREFDFQIVDLVHSEQFPECSCIGDVRDIDSLRDVIDGDIVVHLAAVHRDDVDNQSEYFLTNVEGAKNLVRICEEKNINKIIFTSSVAVYSTEWFSSQFRVNVLSNLYGESKYRSEEVFIDWVENLGDRSLAIVRPAAVFGEGSKGNIHSLFKYIAKGWFILIGDGSNKKSIAYVENLASFLITILTSESKVLVTNYVDQPNLTLRSLVLGCRRILGVKVPLLSIPLIAGLFVGRFMDVLSKMFGIKLPVSAARVKKLVSSTEFDSFDKTLVDFKPNYSLWEGVEKTLKRSFVVIEKK